MPENIDYDDLKKRGFLRQKQDGYFVLRTKMSSGVYTKEQLGALAEISRKYGNGFTHATTRQGIEIPFIKFDDIKKVEKDLESAKIDIGASGPRLRVTTVCPGNNWCRLGLIDTFRLAERIEEELGMKCGMELPHKFKIAVSGCPNGCTRPQATEIGIHGAVDTASPDKHAGYVVYVGGCAGRTPRYGFKLDKIFSEDEALALIGRIVRFFKERAKPRQRLAFLIEEIGRENFLKEIAADFL